MGEWGSQDRASVMAAQPAIGLQACGCALAVTFVFRPCGQDVGQVHTVFTPCASSTRGPQHGLTVRMQAGACKSERVCKRPRLEDAVHHDGAIGIGIGIAARR